MLASIGMLVIVSIWAGARPGFFARGVDVEARFHRVNGLQAGAPVALLGMTVGSVEEVSLSAMPTDEYVVVRMRIEKSAARRLHADAEAQIETIGLLGDKFIELLPGTPRTAILRPGSTLNARDPMDYEALVGRENTRDFLINVYSIAASMRALLDQMQTGRGLLSELVRGDGNGEQPSLRELRQSLQHIDRLSVTLERMLERASDERTLAGALLSDKNDARKVVADLAASISSLRASAARLDRLSARMERARGLLPRLAEDPQLADRLIAEIDQTSHQLERILNKIDTGQGTLGKMVNDPTLYDRADSLLNSGGWGLSVMRGLYGISHPFSSPTSQNQPISSASCACSRASNPNDKVSPDLAPGNGPTAASSAKGP
jgi:phospholipid/cholesterol/gamma-HCH transport system substrate-binding protein